MLRGTKAGERAQGHVPGGAGSQGSSMRHPGGACVHTRGEAHCCGVHFFTLCEGRERSGALSLVMFCVFYESLLYDNV